MDPNNNHPSTPSRRAKKDDMDYLDEDDLRTAVETESLTDARISRDPPPVKQSPRDAWANVTPTSQPRIVPSTRLSQADRDAQEIANSTQRALETLRKSSDPRNRLFVKPESLSQTTPKHAANSPFRPFSGQGRSLASPLKPRSSGVRTGLAASPMQSSVRTAAARSPDVRTGVENSGRSARLREQQQHSRSSSAVRSSRSAVRTAVGDKSSSAHSKKSRKSGCSKVHVATANYEIDLRQRRNSVTGPTTNVSTARTISPAAAQRRGRSPVRNAAPPATNTNMQSPYLDYPPLPSEGDPTEQTVDIIDQNRAEQMYTPHISRPIFLGTSGVHTAQAVSPVRNRTLSERTALGDTSLKTSRSPASKSQKSVRTARSPHSRASLGSYASDDRSISSKMMFPRKPSHHASTRSLKSSQSQNSLATTSARSFASQKSWASATGKTPCGKKLRAAQKSVSMTPATVTARSGNGEFSSNSGASSRASRPSSRTRKPTTPLRTAAMLSTRSAAERTCVSPDAVSSKRSPARTGAPIRPVTPDTPRGWPYRASEQDQTSVRIAPSATRLKTAMYASPRQHKSSKSSKSPALRSQKELHREAKSSGSSKKSRRSQKPTSNVSTARTMASRTPSTSRSTDKSAKELRSSKSNARTFSATTIKAGKRSPVPTTDDGPDMVIETVQAHGNIEIDLCFNFRVRAPPGKGFGESSSPLKPKEVLINGKPIWRKD